MHGTLTATHIFDQHFTSPSNWNLQESPRLTPIETGMAGLLQHRGQIPPTPSEWSIWVQFSVPWQLESYLVDPVIWSGPLQILSPCCRHPFVVPSAPLIHSVADPSLRASADAKNHTAPVAVTFGVSDHGLTISLKAVTWVTFTYLYYLCILSIRNWKANQSKQSSRARTRDAFFLH